MIDAGDAKEPEAGAIRLETREQQAGEYLMREVHEEFGILIVGLRLIDRTLNEIAGNRNTTEDLAASLVLLARVFSDVRGVTLMVRHGYAQQAGALAAAAADAAFAVATVAGNQKAGIAWMTHRKSWRTPESTSEAIRILANRLHPTAAAEARAAYSEVYSILSMSKHGNPMVVSPLGLRTGDGMLHVALGPGASELDALIARDAMLSIALITGKVLQHFSETYQRSYALRVEIANWVNPVVKRMAAHRAEARAQGLRREAESSIDALES